MFKLNQKNMESKRLSYLLGGKRLWIGLLFSFWMYPSGVYAQYTGCAVGPDNRQTSVLPAEGTYTISTGDRISFGVVNGAVYTFNTCGSPYDTRISLHEYNTVIERFVGISSNDDNTVCVNDERVGWTANFTGTLWVTVTGATCEYRNLSAVLYVEQRDNLNVREVADQRGSCGGSVTYTARASIDGPTGGLPPIEYQWQSKTGSTWDDIIGETGSTLFVDNIQPTSFSTLYRARVTLDQYSEFTNSASLLEDSLDPPSGIEASVDNCNGDIEITWLWYMRNPLTFLIEYSLDQDTWIEVAEASGTVRRYVHENVQEGVPYFYRMRTFSSACGAYASTSSVVEGISPLDPVRPSGLSFDMVDEEGGRAIQINWDDADTGEDGFFIEKITNNGGSERFNVPSDDDEKAGTGPRRFLDSNIRNCLPYAYRVYGYNICKEDGLRNFDEEILATVNVSLDSVVLRDSFDASRGYYTDRTTFEWSFNRDADYDYVDHYKIYTRELGSLDKPRLLHSLSDEIFTWETESADAGVLYEYFLVAEGACGEGSNFSFDIDTLDNLGGVYPRYGLGYSVGYRSPSGILHGNITYQGGISVPDVRVTVDREEGQLGHSLYFDGVNDSVYVDTGEALNNMGEEYSVSTWLRPSSLSNEMKVIIFKLGYFMLGIHGDDLSYFVRNGADSWMPVLMNDAAIVGEYVHAALVVRNDSARVYVNGALVNSVRLPNPTETYNQSGMFFGGYPEFNLFYHGHLDEVRIFDIPLSDDDVLRDYSRYLPTDAEGIVAYYRLDEGVGSYMFDLANSGGIFYQNDGDIGGASWSDVIPSNNQLGFAGYTDINGNYTVSGVLYKGVGESFYVTPSITLSGAVHAFSPLQRLVFIGEGSSVLNEVDFLDISSFQVQGQVYFNHEGQRAGSEGVGFYIDGVTPVVSATGNFVLTDENGFFTIQVPIGLHSISARKPFHEFSNNGSWPTLEAQFDFQDIVTGVEIEDLTRRTVIGRVVGGTVQGDKRLGFHESTNNIGQAHFILRSEDNLISQTVDTDPNSGEYIVDLPPNNYNVYKGNQPSQPGIHVHNNLDASIFFTSLRSVDLRETFLPFTEVDTVYTDDTETVIDRIDSVDYHLSRNYIYRSIPQISVEDGREEVDPNTPFVGDEFFIYQSTQGLVDTVDLNYGRPLGVPYPVFTKNRSYAMRIGLIEEYVNATDPSNPVYDYASVSDGELTLTNYLGKGYYMDINRMTQYYSEGSPGISPDVLSLTTGDTLYTFVAAEPDIVINASDPASSFTHTLQITGLAGSNVVYWPGPSQSDVFRGYVYGSTPIGTSFVSAAPEMVDFIVRDPQGSESSASISVGKEVSITNTFNLKTTLGFEAESTIGAGTTTFTGGGIGVIVGIINNISQDVNLGFDFELGLGYEGEFTGTYSTNEEFSTSSDPEFVGADADLYVGRSQNYQFGLSQTLGLVPDDQCVLDEVGCPFDGEVEEFILTSRSGRPYQVGSKVGVFLSPEGNPTFFIYTQRHIKTELLPSLLRLRNSLLLGHPRYVSMVSPEHELYGQNNDYPDWPTPTSVYPDTDPDLDFSGPSYVFTPLDDNDIDSIRWYNQQIRLWEEELATNERLKLEAYNSGLGENISISAGADYTSTYTTENSQTHTTTFELNTSLSYGSSFDLSLFGVELSVDYTWTFKVETGNSIAYSSSEENTFAYTLSDPDEGDFISIGVFNDFQGNGPIFVLSDGGETSCPHEEALVTEYYNPGTVIGNTTLSRDNPRLSVDVPVVYNVPSNSAAVYTLTLYNDNDAGDEQDYRLDVEPSTNPDGAILRVDGAPVGGSRSFQIDGRTAIQKILTLERGPFEYDYEDIVIKLESVCDEDEVFYEFPISAYFLPRCTDIDITSPRDNWVANTSNNDTIFVSIGNYNINYPGLKRIALRYKPSSSSTWILLEEFHRELSDDLDDDAREIPRNIPVIAYPWALGDLVDGSYDILAEAFCEIENSGSIVSSSSEVYSGLIDRVNPHLFGRPEPLDGILSPMDEIAIQFNEPIHPGLLTSFSFDMRGVLNGGDIRHPASVHFDGIASHYVRIPSRIDLTQKAFSIDMYVAREGSGASVLLHQGTVSGRSMEIGFTSSGALYFRLNEEYIEADVVVTNDEFHHYAVVYDPSTTFLTLYVDALVAGMSNSFFTLYETLGDIIVGKSSQDRSFFEGNIHELRIWNRALTQADVSISATQRFNNSATGLIANWRMEEGYGDVVYDYIGSLHAENYADWTIEPNGRSVEFDGVGAYAETTSIGFGPAEDFTIEMWFSTRADKEMALLSNGRGDAVDINVTDWLIGISAGGIFSFAMRMRSFRAKGRIFMIVSGIIWRWCVRRIGNTILYVDGDQVAFTSSDSLTSFAGPKIWLGTRGWYEGSVERRDMFFEGLIDELRIWGTARTQRQLQQGAYARLQSDESALISYYPFETFVDDAGVLMLVPSAANFINEQEQGSLIYQGGLTSSEDAPSVQLARPLSAIPFTYSANEDRIIISPTVDPALIENVILDITVKDVYDLNGNKLSSPVTWSAYVDRNQVVWEDAQLRFELPYREDFRFEATIRNMGGEVANYTLTNLPIWLTADALSGSIAPLETRVVLFSVTPGINIGRYLQDIYLRTDFGHDERLSLDIAVIKALPEDWKIRSEDYQYSMSVVAQVRMDGFFARDESDVLAAVVNGEIRGTASLTYVPTLDSYIAFLSVYSNLIADEEISFRFWRAREGRVYSNLTPRLYFSSNVTRGSIDSPLIFEVPNSIYREVDVRAGWQWMSFNLDASHMPRIDDFLFSFSEVSQGDIFKGLSSFDQYDIELGWVGSMTSSGGISYSDAYKFKSQRSGSFSYEGAVLDPESVSIDLSVGWNWIGYTPQNRLPIATALARHAPVLGDQIKSQFEFAIYGGEAIGWIGSLLAMEPSKGYMYYSQQDASFVFPNSSAIYTPQSVYSIDTDLEKVKGDIRLDRASDNMTIYALLRDYTPSSSEYIVVDIAGKPQGVGIWGESNNQGTVSFINVLWDGTEEALTFKLLNMDTQEVISLRPKNKLSFLINARVGTLESPLELLVDGAESRDTQRLRILPNPIENDLNIVLPTAREELIRVELFSLTGQWLGEIKGEVFVGGGRNYSAEIGSMLGTYTGLIVVKVYTSAQSYTVRIIRR